MQAVNGIILGNEREREREGAREKKMLRMVSITLFSSISFLG